MCNTTKEKITVMQAFEDGRTIQSRPVRSFVWCDDFNPAWSWATFDYRIKPEPEVVYILYNLNGDRIATRSTEESAVAAVEVGWCGSCSYKKFIEVVDDE